MDRPIQRLFAFKFGHHLSQHGSLFPRLTRPPHESLADEFLRVFLAFPGKVKTLVVGWDEDERFPKQLDFFDRVVIEFSSGGDGLPIAPEQLARWGSGSHSG